MGEVIYVIAGKDEPLVNAQCQQLVDELIEPEQRAMGYSCYEGPTASISDILDELRTLPFLADKRVVLIKDADSFVSKSRETLEKYFDRPSSCGVLILAVRSWDSRTKLARKLSKVGECIAVEPPKSAQLPAHLVQYAKQTCRKRLDRDAAELLVELAGDDLTRLCSEVEKLALYAKDERAITTEHVELLIGHNRIFGAFEVIDAVVDGQAGRAIERLRNMFREDRSAEYKVVGAFAFHWRRMFTAKALLEKGTGAGEIAKRLRLWGNRDRFFSQLRRTSLEQIGEALAELAQIDYRAKTGQARVQVALEELVLNLAGVAATRR